MQGHNTSQLQFSKYSPRIDQRISSRSSAWSAQPTTPEARVQRGTQVC